MDFPGQEGKEIDLSGTTETAQGAAVVKQYNFSFDRASISLWCCCIRLIANIGRLYRTELGFGQ